ncbi:mitogen-activated protein kinase kinase kinase 5-like [Vicia villosa]|uniref:mitogen-activated protein kinase kinase kinase 5-like n=1 Tax=Vicia villosa TaxID=3911 RepID=UPI00273BAA75|nr:mitogen-activated protein kinase kinase kinase 5-like [Vicia villosa]
MNYHSMTPTTNNKPSSTTQSLLQRRLPRQRRIDGETFHSTVDVTISLPASPHSSGSYSWSSSPVLQPLPLPLPLPLPESPLTRRPDHHATLPITRKTVDHDAVRRSKSSSNLRRPIFATGSGNAKSDLRVNIPPVSGLVASNGSSKDIRKHSHDNDCEGLTNVKLQFTATSTPTSILSSPLTSSGRLSSVDLSDPSISFPRDLNDILELPAKTPHSSRSSANHSPKQHKTIQGGSYSHHPKFYSRVSSENNHADAHPLPLPPPTRASLQPQQSSAQNQSTAKLHDSTENLHSSTSQWQKGKLIGQGSFGRVYHATNLETGASCAMKEVDLFPDDPMSAHYIKQLDQEIGTLGQLHHPNIMQYYGSELVGDRLRMYMEYVNPGSLQEFMQEHNGVLTESVVRNFTRHILSGLAYLHSNETIHRDIKGANLLVDPSGTLKLAGFGVSKTMTEKSYELSLKSPYWMAPELMMSALMKKNNPNVTTAVDIWSLGCTIIEMLTGKSPWSEFSGHRVVFKVLHRSPDIPETLSQDGKDFLEQCFKRNPADRPSADVLLTHAFVQNLHEQDVIVQSLGTLHKDESRKHSSPGYGSKLSRGVAPASFRARIFSKIQNLIGGTGIRSKSTR